MLDVLHPQIVIGDVLDVRVGVFFDPEVVFFHELASTIKKPAKTDVSSTENSKLEHLDSVDPTSSIADNGERKGERFA